MKINIKRVEYLITYKCTGRCKHCSLGNKVVNAQGHFEYQRSNHFLTELSKITSIESVMCFGGEPLLYSEDTIGVFNEATICQIPCKQIITNGYFSNNKVEITKIARRLIDSGVNDILLSVDSFHQEKIPLEYVLYFAQELSKQNKNYKISVHPAWVISRNENNKWNNRTNELLKPFVDLGIPISQGNNVFMAGNALTYLKDYYPDVKANLKYRCGDSPYSNELDNIDTISIEPNGNVSICHFIIGNIYKDDIQEILKNYNPYINPIMNMLINEGIAGLIEYAKERNIVYETDSVCTACSLCELITTECAKQ